MKKIHSLSIVLLSISISASWKLNANDNTVADETIYRLAETLVPTSYDLSLTIDPAYNTFTGKINITFDVNEEVTINQISLHFDKKYITVKSIKLNNTIGCTAGDPNEASISIVKCTGSATGKDNFLHIEYNATFSTDGYGVVKSTYLDEGKEQSIIKSVFGPTYARRAFPCLDEPNLRARFSLEINHPSQYLPISNSPVNQVVVSSGNWTTTRFDVTPKISTYLLSFLISELHSTEVKSDGGYDLKIFTRADVANSTSKVLQKYFSTILDNLGNYTGLSYRDTIGTDECYQVALPEYSQTTGGFGLFEYRETDLLDDGNQTTQRTIQDIVTNMVYKLAHEWYGGYLTVSWWSDIWSNEAVATYISYTVADYVTDNFDIRNQFVAEVVRKSLQTDAYPFAQPLSSSKSDINDVESITKKLNDVSYQKGASILRMIGYMIGSEDTLKITLVKHLSEGNKTATDGSDLIKDLTEDYSTKDDDLNAYLQSWIFSPGYPLVTAKIVNVTGTGLESIKLSQKRFLYPTNDIKTDNETQWVIPFNGASGEKDFYIRVEGYYVPGRDTTYYHHEMNSYCIFNVQSGFFYRVNYDEVLWNRIFSYLKDETQMKLIDPLSRAQLIDDVFNIARTGEVAYSIAFRLAEFLESDTDYYTWYAAFDAFSYLLGKTGDDVVEENLRIYILQLMDKVLKESNKKEGSTETHIDVLRRVLVTKWACKLNHTETVKSTVEQFEKIKADPSSLEDPNLRSIIYCNGIRYSEHSIQEMNYLWDLYINSTSVHEKKDILNAVGCSESRAILVLHLLKIITLDSGIKGEDALTVFKSIFSSPAGISAATFFLDINITEVVALDKNIWPEMLYTLAEQLYTDEHLKWINDKLDDKIFDGYDDIKSKIRTLTSVNNYWTNNFQVYVKEILINSPIAPTTSTTTTAKPTSIPTTTQEKPTTPSSASAIAFSNIAASFIVLMVLVLN